MIKLQRVIKALNHVSGTNCYPCVRYGPEITKDEDDVLRVKYLDKIDETKTEIANREGADINYVTNSDAILELCKNAHDLYLSQNHFFRILRTPTSHIKSEIFKKLLLIKEQL